MKAKNKSRVHLLSPVVLSGAESATPLNGGGVRVGDKGLEIVFPQVPSPQVISIGTWQGMEHLAQEIAEWLFANYRDKRTNKRQHSSFLIRQFMHWLNRWDNTHFMKSSFDMNQSLVDAYLNFLQHDSGLSY